MNAETPKRFRTVSLGDWLELAKRSGVPHTARRPGTMLRWDCCSSEDLKHAMAYGHKPSREILERLTIDSRIIDLGLAYPGDEVAVWQRP